MEISSCATSALHLSTVVTVCLLGTCLCERDVKLAQPCSFCRQNFLGEKKFTFKEPSFILHKMTNYHLRIWHPPPSQPYLQLPEEHMPLTGLHVSLSSQWQMWEHFRPKVPDGQAGRKKKVFIFSMNQIILRQHCYTLQGCPSTAVTNDYHACTYLLPSTLMHSPTFW